MLTRPFGLLKTPIRPIGLIALILLSHQAFAQDSTSAPGQYIRLGIAPAFYSGDLIPQTAKLSAFVNIGLRFNQKQRLNGSFQATIGSLISQNPGYQYKDDINTTPNTFFKTSVVSITYDLAYNFIAKERFRAFAGVGIGILRYQPKDDLGNKLLDDPNTRPDGETYSNTSAVIPIKVGAAYFLPNQFGIELQGLMMNPQTDFIDNIAGWGNRQGNDQYYMIQLNLLIPLRI